MIQALEFEMAEMIVFFKDFNPKLMLWFNAGWGRSWQTKGKTQWGIVQYMVNTCI